MPQDAETNERERAILERARDPLLRRAAAKHLESPLLEAAR
jgi:hypothetical protein